MALFDTGSYSIVSINFFFYGALALQYYCFYVYRKLPPHERSLRKFLLRFMIWFLSTAIMSGVVRLCAPYYSTLEALPFYILAIFGSAFLFYVYLVCEDDELCCSCGGEGTCDFCRQGSESDSLEKLV